MRARAKTVGPIDKGFQWGQRIVGIWVSVELVGGTGNEVQRVTDYIGIAVFDNVTAVPMDMSGYSVLGEIKIA